MKKLLVEARENMHSLNDLSLPLIPHPLSAYISLYESSG